MLIKYAWGYSLWGLLAGGMLAMPVWGQVPALPLPGSTDVELPPPRDVLPPAPTLPPEVPLPVLPPPEDLLPPGPAPPDVPTPTIDVPDTIRVERFEVVGSTVFSPEELRQVTAPFTGRDITFNELLQARSAVTQLYIDRGYITSGALVPPQQLESGVVQIQVIEGQLTEINVSGLRRLQPGYVRQRLAIAGATPLNTQRLLQGLQLLQLDPLIETISADLQAGTRPGTSVLEVQAVEADTWRTELLLDNGRSPSVGSFRRQAQVTQANLLGWGDGLSLGYSNTDGSNRLEATYTLPVNPRNGTLSLAYSFTDSEVIEPPFDLLEIGATSRAYELTLRQPLHQTTAEEFALGLTLSRQESQTEIGFNDIGPFPLSPGADDQGRTRILSLRLFQEWTQRSSRQVIALRSQFSLGLDLLDATVNQDVPDSQFLAWRGQGQWVRLLAPDTLLLLRGELQLADQQLVPLEQFGLGGQPTIRGYRQDELLTDNGGLLSAEVRLPLYRDRRIDGLLQLAPFVDVGTAWNSAGPNPDPQTLAGIGLGLLWRQGDRLSARLDFGIPLIAVDGSERTWQESGVYFSLSYSPF